jgi:hypothetical protein
MSPDAAASVRARLLNQAKARREEFERTLVRFAGERLLYRIGESTVRCMCSVSGSRGRWKPGRSASTSW